MSSKGGMDEIMVLIGGASKLQAKPLNNPILISFCSFISITFPIFWAASLDIVSRWWPLHNVFFCEIPSNSSTD